MALPVLRGCSRFPFGRVFLNESVVLSCSGRPRPSPPGPATCERRTGAPQVRFYSSERGQQKQVQKLVVVGLPNPFIWFRTRIYYFLIRAYFDKEFNIQEFTEGAKQAFSHVSRLLSLSQFAALDGLVAQDLVGKLQERCSVLPPSHRQALCAQADQIMYSTAGDVGIYYDDDGRKFVSILMRFWYLTSAHLSDDGMEGTPVFHVALGGEGEAETKRLLSANYEFQREFTKGVSPDWTITRIEHSKLLDE